MKTHLMASDDLIQSGYTSSIFARILPLIIMTPTSVALIWIQITQLWHISFSAAASVAVALFTIVFIAMVIGATWHTHIRTLSRDLSWIPLAVICLGFALLGFVLVRWDADDTHYLSNAVYFLSHPKTRMGFEAYYIHVDDAPFKAISWINSYAIEFLLASFAHVLKFDFLSLHWSGKTLIAAFIIPCSWYSLFRRFTKRHDTVLVAICISLLVIFIMGDTFNSFGNWFLTRLFHGKVIVVALGLPLIWNHTIGYLDRPNIGDWGALFVVSSAMIGLSTMAGILIPATMAPLVLAYCIANKIKIWSNVKQLFGLASAFTYLLSVTVYIRLHVNPVILQNDSIINGHYPTNYLGQISFITNPTFPLSAFIMFGATLLCLKFVSADRRRLIAWWCGIYGVFFLTPLTAPLLIEHLTTSNTYWRLFHGYPIPLVIGISVAGLFTYTRSLNQHRKIMAFAISAIALGSPHVILILQILFGWDRTAPTIIRAIHRISAGGYRISDVRLADIKAVLSRLPDGSVLAAQPINADIPVFSGTHPLIYARMTETEFWFQTRGNPEKGNRRRAAMQFASGTSNHSKNDFFSVLDEEPNLKSLVLLPDALTLAGVSEKIAANGFNDIGTAGRYRLFTRK